MNPFLAMIIPMGGGTGIWGGGNVPMPTPPIQMPPNQPPGGIWGGGNQPFPTPPINMPPGQGGQQPPGIWGGGNVPMPNPPIALPPDPNAEGWEEVYIQGMGWTKIIKKEDAKSGS